jgi:hypothetical protein
MWFIRDQKTDLSCPDYLCGIFGKLLARALSNVKVLYPFYAIFKILLFILKGKISILML